MEVMDSPLNRAHHYSRKADQLVVKEKYEEAIVCHGEAAELLKEALSMTQSEQVRLSLELQRDRHLQQRRLIKMSCEQAKLKGKLSAAKDDKTRLEEQSTAIADLWKLTAVLLMENKRLLEERDGLQAENAGLKRGSYEGHQSPSASLTQPLSLGMRLLHVTPDLRQEIQMLLETANDG